MFFAYNNGITVTAVEIKTSENMDGTLMLTGAKHLQIVNGGQTTASLSSARRRDKASLEHIYVQMKLSVLEPERAPKVVPNISRYANSQNKVTEADFFANHPFHWRMEEISRRIWAPAIGGAQHGTKWFYERARGQYLNEQSKLTPAERKRFLEQNPREKVITKTDLAKYENSWRCLPHKVSLGAQKNFREFAEYVDKEWEKSEAYFNEEFFRRLVAKAIMFRQTERIVSGQSWYQGGYRANVVTYTLAKLANMIKISASGRTINFQTIWNNQGLSNAIKHQIEIIAEKVFQIIANPETGFQNVTEWCKKENCWKQVQDKNIMLSKNVLAELTEPEEERSILHNAHLQQVVDNGITSQSIVINLGQSYWKKMAEWVSNNRHFAAITAEEKQFLRVACNIPNKIPNSWQSTVLLALKKRVEKDGFPRQE